MFLCRDFFLLAHILYVCDINLCMIKITSRRYTSEVWHGAEVSGRLRGEFVDVGQQLI